MAGEGAALRARREALGLTLESVAEATRIPLAHLVSLEAERRDDLPAGPYASAYVRSLWQFYGPGQPTPVDPWPETPGLDDGGERERSSTVRGSAGPPLQLVRTLAIVSACALGVVLVSAVADRVAQLEMAVPAATSTQEIRLVARRRARVRVAVDGGRAIENVMAPDEVLDYRAARRIEVELDAVDDVRVYWNGDLLQPQGHQRASRRLVFVDDVAEPGLGGGRDR